MTTLAVETEPPAMSAPPATKPQPSRPPPVVDDVAPDLHSCIICNRDLHVEAPDDLRDGVFCQSFGNPSSGAHDFTTSHQIAEFGICAGCWRGAVDDGVIRFHSLTQRVFMFNWHSSCAAGMLDPLAAIFAEPGRCTPEERAELKEKGYVGIYKTVRVTDGAELLADGSWRLPSGEVLRPH